MVCINDETDSREIHTVVLYTALIDLYKVVAYLHLLVFICNHFWTLHVYLLEERGVYFVTKTSQNLVSVITHAYKSTLLSNYTITVRIKHRYLSNMTCGGAFLVA